MESNSQEAETTAKTPRTVHDDGGGGLAHHLWQDWQAKHFHGDIALVVMDMVVDLDLLTIFSRTGRPSIVMGEDQPPFIWDHVNAANASHLNIGNMMMMDQVILITSV